MQKLIAYVCLALLAGIVLIGCSRGVVTVSKVYDGDSFVMANGDEVRLIGIDAPEKGQPGAEEAKAFLTKLIQGKQIRLEADKENRDKYNRLLRYAYLPAERSPEGVVETFVNAEMLKHSYAVTLFITPNSRYRTELTRLETVARYTRIGIWASDVPIYITDTGGKYHRAGCQHLAKSKKLITLEEAQKQYYGPCKVCRPPE